MLNIYMDSNGEFEYEGIKWKIDITRKDGRKYIQLYKNGSEWTNVSDNALTCAGIEHNTLSQFMSVLKEAVNDNFFSSKINVTIPLEVFRDLFKKWK